jgi:nitrogen regulatory protein PII
MNKELLICIINDPRILDAILESFLEHGISGATVIDSRGMGNILTQEIPIFTGLKTLFPGGGAGNHMVFSVMSPEQVDEIVPVIQEICDDFNKPGLGVLFTLPVNRMIGFQSKKKK